MPRARNIKPSFFDNEDLPTIPALGRLLFIGLWTLADREGRLEDRPRKIKGQLFPYEECDVDKYLTQLTQMGFLIRYVSGGMGYIQIRNFTKHQTPHHSEKASLCPAPEPTAENYATSCVEIPLIPDSLLLNPDTRILIPEDNPEKESGKRVKKIYNPDFEKFWLSYPKERRCEKPDAEKAWKVACQIETPEKLYDSLQAYLKSKECLSGYAPYPAKWLKKQRYNEEFYDGNKAGFAGEYRVNDNNGKKKPDSNRDVFMSAIFNAATPDKPL